MTIKWACGFPAGLFLYVSGISFHKFHFEIAQVIARSYLLLTS